LPSHEHADPRGANVTSRGLGLGFDLFRVSSRRATAMDYMATDFGTNRWSQSADKQTNRVNRHTDASDRPTPRRRLYSRRGKLIIHL